jgi:hypothetical protein
MNSHILVLLEGIVNLPERVRIGSLTSFVKSHKLSIAGVGLAAWLVTTNRGNKAIVATFNWVNQQLIQKLAPLSSPLHSSLTDWGVQISSRAFTKFGKRVNENIHRTFLTGFEVTARKSPGAHSHGESAAERTAVTGSIDDWIISNGFEVYSIAASGRDKDTLGYHQYYMPRDFITPPVNRKINGNDIIKVVDVDYYLDLPRWLGYGRPMVLYTFMPMKVSGTVDDGHFTIKDDVVTYNVNGGATYEHRLWNIARDWIITDHWWGCQISSIETRHVSEHRRVVMITPSYRVYGPFWWFIGQYKDRLCYRKISKDGVNRLDTMDKQGKRMVSIGLEGKYTSVELPYDLFEAIKVRRKETKNPEIHTVERYLMQTVFKEHFPQPSVTAAILHGILSVADPQPRELLPRGGTQYLLRTFQAVGTTSDYLVTEDGKRYGRVVGTPIINTESEALVARDSYNNDLLSVQGRVIKPHNDVIPPSKYNQWAGEFVRFLIPQPHTGIPWTVDRIIEMQNRPTQRARSDKSKNWLETDDTTTISGFMKHEASSKLSEPRMISAVTNRQTLLLATYVYGFVEGVLKHQPWYAPGKTPEQVTRQIMIIARRGPRISQTDYHRFDASVSLWSQCRIVRACMLRWVHDTHRSHLANLIDAEIHANARTKHGIMFALAGIVVTGSSKTALGNSLINTSNDYFAARHTMSPLDSFDSLGIYCGDDGDSTNDPTSIQLVASDLGMQIDCQIAREGDAVKFIGRVFLDPWTTPASVQDPLRTIGKLHVSTSSRSVPDHVALFNRASGYLELDPNAPITSAWCKRQLRQLRRDFPALDFDAAITKHEHLDRDRPYFVSRAKAGHAEGTFRGWPQPAENCALAYQRVAEALGVDSTQIREWHDLIGGTGTDAEIERCIQLPIPTTKIGAIIDGDSEIIGSPPAVPSNRIPSRAVVRARWTDLVQSETGEHTNRSHGATKEPATWVRGGRSNQRGRGNGSRRGSRN